MGTFTVSPGFPACCRDPIRLSVSPAAHEEIIRHAPDGSLRIGEGPCAGMAVEIRRTA